MKELFEPGSIFPKILPDLSKSFGSNLYDINEEKHFLDLFANFSSLPLGFNPPCLQTNNFREEVEPYLYQRTSLCAYDNPLTQRFHKALTQLTDIRGYSGITLAETGALAVEQALKLALLTLGPDTLILTVTRSYHGIYGLSSLLTAASSSASERLPFVTNDQYTIKACETAQDILNEFYSQKKVIIIVEPLLCTSGDLALPRDIVEIIGKLQSDPGVFLISDEIQTGLFSTAMSWGYQLHNFNPDIIVFGKKTQVCGMLVKADSKTLIGASNPKYFSSTFDASPIDIIRAIHIFDYIMSVKNSLQERLRSYTGLLSTAHNYLPHVIRTNSVGSLHALEFDTMENRNLVYKKLYDNNILSNPTGPCTIRFRFSLEPKQEDVDKLLSVLYS